MSKCVLSDIDHNIPGAIRIIRSQEPLKNEVGPSCLNIDFKQSHVLV